MNKNIYELITPAVNALCAELEKIYPGITNHQYENADEDTTFFSRLRMGVYIELIKAGFIK
jgi:hypothetical protein